MDHEQQHPDYFISLLNTWTSEHDQQIDHIHDYTAGRWLLADAAERKARHINFNFPLLCERAIGFCKRAHSITSWTKREGNSCKVFIFTTNTGERVVVKLPTSAAGPKSLTTNSEVATIKYLQRNTTVPIPRILDWSDDASNDIGCEYIIMDYAAGVPASQLWETLDIGQQMRCLGSVVKHMAQMTRLGFPAYGSLLFSDASFVDPSRKRALADDTSIGPSCATRLRPVVDHQASQAPSSAPGPWDSLPSYCAGLIDAGLARLPSEESTAHQRPFQGSIAEHITLLNHAGQVLQALVRDHRLERNGSPTMMHPDLHLQNIFVDPDDCTKITAIIDWQGTSIEPAFEHTAMPFDLANQFIESVSDETKTLQLDILETAYDAFVKVYDSRLASARSLDESLFRLFRYCYRSWHDGAPALRNELIDISGRWQELDLPGQCPYTSPSGDELKDHNKNLEVMQGALDLKRGLVAQLGATNDGWIPTELWDEAQAKHAEAFKIVSDTFAAPDSDMSVEDLKAIWPFDKPSQ